MKFNVNGIIFSESELITIQLDKLIQGKICGHHLFIQIGTKPFLVLRAGDVIDTEFLQKYKTKGITTFKAFEIIDRETIHTFVLHFAKIKQTKIKTEQLEKVEKFFLDYYSILQSNESNASYLSFISACFNTFYTLGEDTINRLQSASITLLQRAMVCSSQAVVAAMADGHYDFLFLQDIFNLCFILDIGLATPDLNYAVIKACEAERNVPGSGKNELISQGRGGKDLETFLEHPIVSAEYGERHERFFNYPELTQVIELHHEKSDGGGFPRGVAHSSLASWEALVCFADSITEFKEWVFVRGDGNKFVADALEKLERVNTKDLLPIRKVASNVSSMFEWAKGRNVKEMNQEEKEAI